MMSYFPSRDVEEPATKEFVRAEMAEMRVEMAEMKADIITTIAADLRRELHRTLLINLGTLVAFAGVIIAAVRA